MVSTRWPWFSFMCNTTMFIQPQDKTTATTGAGGQQWKGGGGGRRPTSWFICPKLDTAVWKSFKVWRSPNRPHYRRWTGPATGLGPQEGQYYRPVATRRAVLQAWGHKKGSTTGLGPQEGQLNDRRHTAYCGHITTQQAVFTHLPVRAGKVLFLSSSNCKINKGG